MNCPECGTKGYRRSTKIPEWRCRKCSHEWDVDTSIHPVDKIYPFDPQSMRLKFGDTDSHGGLSFGQTADEWILSIVYVGAFALVVFLSL